MKPLEMQQVLSKTHMLHLFCETTHETPGNAKDSDYNTYTTFSLSNDAWNFWTFNRFWVKHISYFFFIQRHMTPPRNATDSEYNKYITFSFWNDTWNPMKCNRFSVQHIYYIFFVKRHMKPLEMQQILSTAHILHFLCETTHETPGNATDSEYNTYITFSW